MKARIPMAEAIVHVFRGTQEGGRTYPDDPVPVYKGMVVLDAVYNLQATSVPDLVATREERW